MVKIENWKSLILNEITTNKFFFFFNLPDFGKSNPIIPPKKKTERLNNMYEEHSKTILSIQIRTVVTHSLHTPNKLSSPL